MNSHSVAAVLLLAVAIASFVNSTTVTVSVVRRNKALKRVSALCKDEGAGYAYYNATGQCYKVGTDGPCEALMIFSLDPTSPDYGQCDCDYHRQCGRPIIKWPADGECYYVFDQGPCADDEWISLKEDKTAICSRNICQAEEAKRPSNGTNYWFVENGTCYQTNSRGYCEDPNARLFFKSQDYKPTCNFGLLCGTAKRIGLEGLIKLWSLHQQGNSSANSIAQTYIADITDKTRMKEFVQRLRLVALQPGNTTGSSNISNQTSSE